VSKGQLKKAHNAILSSCIPHDSPGWYAARAAQAATSVSMVAPHGSYLWTQAADATDLASLASSPDRRGEQAAHADLLRDILGNPFRPFLPPPASLLSWQKGLILRMLEAIEEGRSLPSGQLDTARLAVLGDALEDAGCTDAQLLVHLRLPGLHVKGCLAVDAILGQT
jgi:hypothetical protein